MCGAAQVQGRMQTSAHVARATVRFWHNYFYFGHPVVYISSLFSFGYPVNSIPVPQIAKYIYFLVLLLRATPVKSDLQLEILGCSS